MTQMEKGRQDKAKRQRNEIDMGECAIYNEAVDNKLPFCLLKNMSLQKKKIPKATNKV